MHVDGVFPLTFVLHQIGLCESLQGLILDKVLHPLRGTAESPQALERLGRGYDMMVLRNV